MTGAKRHISFVFGCHCHQPVGNFDEVFQRAYEQAYLPFLKVLKMHPGVKVALHYSGPLYDWFIEHQPEFIDILRKLVYQGRVELLSGGYYEPLLAVIPEWDRRAQIDTMSEFIRRNFEVEPEGFWVTERVWEPFLPTPLAEAGIKYVPIDDVHFKCSGLTEDQLFGYYSTEDLGNRLFLFPILKNLRYSVPFRPVSETIEFLRNNASEDGRRVAVLHDDGEKFGLWPETHGSVYGEGWLEEFFTALEDNADWLHSVTYSEFLRVAPPLAPVYLPTASYTEMMEWALPPKAQHDLLGFSDDVKRAHNDNHDYMRFVRGGFWRNFLAKYPESNNLHKKMLRVSNKVHRAIASRSHPGAALEKAQRALMKGQCNCAYWHGVFGGLYLPHLRSAVYSNLLEAEKTVDEIERSGSAPSVAVEQTDFDADGSDEIILSNPLLALYISPRDGGTLFELDFKPLNLNLLDTLARREEAYHRELNEAECGMSRNVQQDAVASIHDIHAAKEEGLHQLLVYDRYRRTSLRDHCLSMDTSFRDFSRCAAEPVAEFACARYEVHIERSGSEPTVHLHRSSSPFEPTLSVNKAIALHPMDSSFSVTHTLQNNSDKTIGLIFGSETNVAFQSGSGPGRGYFSRDVKFEKDWPDSSGVVEEIRHVGLRDEYLGVAYECNYGQPAALWRFPVETVSQSESGQERGYQSSVLFPNWRIELEPQEQWSVAVEHSIHNL